MKLIQLAAMVIACVGSIACQAATIKFPTVCSAFDRRGDGATSISSDGKIDIRVSPASGGESILFSTSSGNNLDGAFRCGIFFDHDSHYIAVGVNPVGLNRGPLHILVGDLTTKKLVGSFLVKPGAALGESIDLVGFLCDSSNLVVLGRGVSPTKSFSVTLFRVTGEQENSPETHILPENTASVGNTKWVDAPHNRLWLTSRPQSCPLRSVPLIGSGPEGVMVNEPGTEAACDADFAIAYPDENTIITAATHGDTDAVTEINLVQHRVQQVDLLPPKGRYTSVDGGSLSPDGKFFAVSRQMLSLSLFGDTRFHGTEIDIVQVSPLKLIGDFHLEPTAASESISIDHRNGAVKMLSFDFKSGVWKLQRLKVQ